MTAFRRIRSLSGAILLAATLLGLCPAAADEVVLVPSRVIYPGETVTLAALKEVTLRSGKTRPDAVLTRENELEGKVAKRTLLPGRYIATNAIRNAWLVEQGASVTLVFRSGGLEITAAAITLEPGSAGDLVKVRNIDSGKVLTGTVMADGSVQVGLS